MATKTEYYLIKSFDANIETPVNIQLDAPEKDAMLAAIEQLGYIFCARDVDGS